MDWKELDITVTTKLGNFRLVCLGYYFESNQNPVIQVFKEDEEWGKLTVNIPDWVPNNDNEILVKTWTENESWVPLILENGPFRDTERRVPTGFVHAQVWEYVEKLEALTL